MPKPRPNRNHARFRFDFDGASTDRLEQEITATVIKLQELLEDGMAREAFYESVRLGVYWTEFRFRGQQMGLGLEAERAAVPEHWQHDS